MKLRLRSMVCAVVAVIALARLGSTQAVADTIPYTEALVSTFNPDESVTPTVIHSSPATASTVNYSQSGDWGSVSGFASADLSTGQLKVSASNNPLAGSSPYMQTNAWFGDGFRTSDAGGSPFSWQPNTGARFSFDLTGNSVSASSPQLGNVGFGVGGFVILSLYRPGTLDPNGKLIGGENNIGYYLYLLGNPNQNLIYTDPQGQYHSLIPSAYYGNIAHDIHIAQNFQPNGDFDWAVLVGVAGQVSGPQFFNIDLSHTLTVGYSGPAGATTTSVSGLFHNFRSVPEPGASALLAIGLVGFFGRRVLGRASSHTHGPRD